MSTADPTKTPGVKYVIGWLIDWFLVFNATFSNISAISWRPVLVVEEVECTLFCNLQSRARTHAVLVIGLYELLDNPTTKLI